MMALPKDGPWPVVTPVVLGVGPVDGPHRAVPTAEALPVAEVAGVGPTAAVHGRQLVVRALPVHHRAPRAQVVLRLALHWGLLFAAVLFGGAHRHCEFLGLQLLSQGGNLRIFSRYNTW